MNKSFICLTLLLAVSLSACGAKSTAPPSTTPTTPSTTPPAANQGTGDTTGGTTAGGTVSTADASAIYKQNCISCHGNNLEGSVGPSLQKVGAKDSKDQISTILNNGKGAMPSFKGRLSDTEIGALATWLSEKK
ncbi:c-type cytochrome [Paenibacillus agricola]|uniref:Cytochrome c n=1 Tax=Paenibacillus agricola TaxID=2716264 RepID=A0ABX0J5N2_9BACL|nr:cytochrome c [Paenibacillus agricola]NHN31717.1 cytochrome c [Paenibacillus agricola]